MEKNMENTTFTEFDLDVRVEQVPAGAENSKDHSGNSSDPSCGN